jgi:phage repressor protein C with HTH and peptisase S24 domain
MWDTVGKKIRSLRKALGENQATFGARFEVEQATVSRWEKGEPVQRKHHEPLAQMAGMSVAEFFHTTVEPRLIPIVGYVSGGESFTPVDDHEPGGGIDHVMLTIEQDDQVAVRVRGDSMRPVYRNGDVIIGSRVQGRDMTKVIGADCVIRTASGEGYVKTVHRGTKAVLFRLRSYNPMYEDLEDVELEWAAPISHVIRSRQ